MACKCTEIGSIRHLGDDGSPSLPSLAGVAGTTLATVYVVVGLTCDSVNVPDCGDTYEV